MKEHLVLTALILICTLVLTGCFCEHEWEEANCTNPKICVKCEETEGAALGHTWMAATCTEPKTCEVCGITEGQAKGHSMVDATCMVAMHCSACNYTEGEPLGHVWIDATTEAPKTCTTCGETEGERIVTDARFKTDANAALFGKWVCEIPITGEMLGFSDFEGNFSLAFCCEFGNAGDVSISVQMNDDQGFMDAIIHASVAQAYAELATEGINKEDADAAMQQAYGMSVEDYVKTTFEDINATDLINSIFAATAINGVYYVEGDSLYTGDSWDSEMEPSAFTIDGDQLQIDDISEGMGFACPLTRVNE